MINAVRGKISLSGDLVEISADFICIIKAFYGMLSREVGEETANFIVADMGRAAFGEGLPDREEIERRMRERSGNEQR